MLRAPISAIATTTVTPTTTTLAMPTITFAPDLIFATIFKITQKLKELISIRKENRQGDAF